MKAAFNLPSQTRNPTKKKRDGKRNTMEEMTRRKEQKMKTENGNTRLLPM
jgi:hypothetical protein